jgi:hypothetical protein
MVLRGERKKEDGYSATHARKREQRTGPARCVAFSTTMTASKVSTLGLNRDKFCEFYKVLEII